MYAAGGDHPLREPCRGVLRLVGRRAAAFISSAEVLQEVLHRYLALRRWQTAREAFLRFNAVMQGRFEPLLPQDVAKAAILADRYPEASARDLAHVAVMLRVGSTHIVSADRWFDVASEVQRLDPQDVAVWSAALLQP